MELAAVIGLVAGVVIGWLGYVYLNLPNVNVLLGAGRRYSELLRFEGFRA